MMIVKRTPRRSQRRQARMAALSAVLVLLACEARRDPPAPQRAAGQPSASTIERSAFAGRPKLPAELESEARDPDASAEDKAPPPHEGPWFIVTDPSVGIYAEPVVDRKLKLGYARSGGRIPVKPDLVQKSNCSKGWHVLVDGGFVCGTGGTVNEDAPAARFTLKPPDLDAELPYPYARNAKNGTPLYKSVPSREQMNQYEPYLVKAKEKKKDPPAAPKDTAATRGAPKSDAGGPRTDLLVREDRIREKDTGSPSPAATDIDAPEPAPELAAGDADAGTVDAGEESIPWWQGDDSKEKLHNFNLAELHDDADDVLAKRLVQGFYVAVSGLFRWNDRGWYKTTQGLVAPIDRFWQTPAPKFQGSELDGAEFKLPIAWVYGRKSTSGYVIDDAARSIKPKTTYERFALVRLTGETTEHAGKKYHQDTAGQWVRTDHLRIAEVAAPPEDLAPGEHWIDVNLRNQTLVAYAGTEAKYATLVSSGKESKVKEKDHRTPRGSFRIREKHITTTMDGDGTESDLPYSIEDVPYVMFFHRAYALHGAFWHQNFGAQMSHGCVNLAPRDAKWLYYFTDPSPHRGWHGVWARETNPGSRIVLHD